MRRMESKNIVSAGELIRKRIACLNIRQVELAHRCNEHFQTISAVLNGKREISIPLSIKLDDALGFKLGTIAQAQALYLANIEASKRKAIGFEERKLQILSKIKANGGLWSYDGVPENLDDDSIIEAALFSLDLEDLPLLLQNWSIAHIKRVWKERMVSQGSRLNILNYILALKFFGIKKPDNYLNRYAKA